MGKEIGNKTNTEKSIMEQAITDYNQIKEAAEANAAKKLASEFPEKFENLIKEELDKNKKKPEKEPYKMVKDEEPEKKEDGEDGTDDKKETVMKSGKKEANKAVNEEREKDFTGDVENDTPNLEKGKKDGVAYTEKTKESKDVQGDKKELTEEFDITDLDLDGVENTIDGADVDDEVITMDEIEREISEMEKINGEIQEENTENSFSLTSLKDKLQEMLGSIQQMEEMHQTGPSKDVVNKLHNGGEQINSQLIDEVKPDLGCEVDEAMGMAHSSSKHVAGDHLPGKDFATHRHKRAGSYNNTQNESVNKKFQSLLEENKKLVKKLNESKEYKESSSKLMEKYKSALEKYRNQLNEMAIFNTNLAHVNNLLINESLALTQEDKVKIINDFKSVKNIGESKEKYNALLSEMKSSKKTISESIETKH
jgi:hypothetical protein